MKSSPARSICLVIMLLVIMMLAVVNKGFAGDDSQVLLGKWVRSGGGYELTIEKILPSGKLKASYYNPQYAKDINVGEANYEVRNGEITVYVKLVDFDNHYRGNYYNLAYDAKDNKLKGKYHLFRKTSSEVTNVNFTKADK